MNSATASGAATMSSRRSASRLIKQPRLRNDFSPERLSQSAFGNQFVMGQRPAPCYRLRGHADDIREQDRYQAMNRIPTLDGWRGIAILLVLIEHTGTA